MQDLEYEVALSSWSAAVRGIELTAAAGSFLDTPGGVSPSRGGREGARRAAEPTKPYVRSRLPDRKEMTGCPKRCEILHDELPNMQVHDREPISPDLADALIRGKLEWPSCGRSAGTGPGIQV